MIGQILSFPDLSRGICGRETCPQTGRGHIQGTLVFKKAKRFSGVKALLPDAHWEPCRDVNASWEYCGKEGQATSTDLRKRSNREITAYKDAVLSGASEEVLMDEHTAIWARYPQLASRIRTAKASRTRSPPRVLWLYGQTGVGKTRWAWDKFPDLDTVTYQNSGGFFLGMRGSKTCLLDDFRPWDIPFNLLLRLLDRYPVMVPVKGGEMAWTYETIIVTGPYHPRALDARGEDIGQLVRRITHFFGFPDEIVMADHAVGPAREIEDPAVRADLEAPIDFGHLERMVHEEVA